MEQKILRKVVPVGGMTCAGCEARIENRLKKLEGVVEAKAIYSSSNVYVTYDANVVSLDEIQDEIETLDYTVKNKNRDRVNGAGAVQAGAARKSAEAEGKPSGGKTEDKMTVPQLAGIAVIVVALYVIIQNTVGFNFIPQVNPNMGYGILFAVGVITSLHCMAMCGGINLSQCISYQSGSGEPGREPGKAARLKPSLLYNAGRVVSYTVLGGIVGALGSAVSFSGMAKGIVAVLSGVFMVIMGINMLGVFPWLRRLNPRMPRFFGDKARNAGGKYGPFYVGLLNGLMPCGPLQAMQIYALGTGNALAGAASMFFFSLGTLPLMFGFGAVSSFLSGKFTRRMLKASAMLVVILGVIMLNRGLSLSGISLPGILPGGSAYAASAAGSVARMEGDSQVVETRLEPGRYTPITVQKGIPVKWTIRAEEGDINGCNGTLIIPGMDITRKLVPGDNLIEFTPDEAGTIPYSCWMGMIRSTIKVVEDVTNVSNSDIVQSAGSGLAGGAADDAGGAIGGCCGGVLPQTGTSGG
jgi:sulfite exporter TauE/SafE/copper chaperone CopZ